MNNQSDWLNRANYTAEERRHMCVQLLSEAQYWDVHQYQKMMHDSTKRPWVGLTDEELHEVCNSMDYYGDRGLVELIEAKLKEKM
jgi:hypothetical protein